MSRRSWVQFPVWSSFSALTHLAVLVCHPQTAPVGKASLPSAHYFSLQVKVVVTGKFTWGSSILWWEKNSAHPSNTSSAGRHESFFNLWKHDLYILLYSFGTWSRIITHQHPVIGLPGSGRGCQAVKISCSVGPESCFFILEHLVKWTIFMPGISLNSFSSQVLGES